MFTFGIFTTHLPYITIVAFYAYFLIFGVNQAADCKIKISEKSITVQIHLDNSFEQAPADTYSFYSSLTESREIDIFEKTKVKQKFKLFGADKLFPQDSHANTLFSRPPPAIA